MKRVNNMGIRRESAINYLYLVQMFLHSPIFKGVTLLDLEERDLPGVAYRAVEAMVVKELIRPEERAMIMRALLLKHKVRISRHIFVSVKITDNG